MREKETQRGREKEEGGKAHQKTKHERELLKNQMKMKLYFCAWKKIKSNYVFLQAPVLVASSTQTPYSCVLVFRNPNGNLRNGTQLPARDARATEMGSRAFRG